MLTCTHRFARHPQFSRITVLQDVLHESPTATTSPLLSAVTPKSPTFGVLTRFQLVPFHCSAKPFPTAQMLLAETAAIALNRLLRLFENGFTLGTTVQLAPFQCAICSKASGCSPLLDPAAQTFVSAPSPALDRQSLQRYIRGIASSSGRAACVINVRRRLSIGRK